MTLQALGCLSWNVSRMCRLCRERIKLVLVLIQVAAIWLQSKLQPYRKSMEPSHI